MKKQIFTLVALLMVTTMAFSQAKKPTLMVVPSDAWCNQHGYVQQFDNQGAMQTIPDYQTALANDMELKLVIAKINDLMAERGFPCKDLEQSIKIVNQQTAEMNLTTSKSGNALAESPIDRLMRTAKADVILEVTWNVTIVGPKRTMSFVLRGLDAYTGKDLGGATGTSSPSYSTDVAVLLEEAVLAHIDNFNNRLQAHFDDLFTNGREVSLEVRVFEDNAQGVDLETEFGDAELIELIDAWMAENTVQGRFSKLGSSENYVIYEQVRIPLYNTAGVAMDTEAFARELRKYLRKEPLKLQVKLLNRGLGRVVLVIGEK